MWRSGRGAEGDRRTRRSGGFRAVPGPVRATAVLRWIGGLAAYAGGGAVLGTAAGGAGEGVYDRGRCGDGPLRARRVATAADCGNDRVRQPRVGRRHAPARNG